MDTVTPESSAAGEAESPQGEAWCLTRVGTTADWLRLPDHQEVTVGRGVDVTYQLISPTFPLMISRLHCVFKQKGDGHWTVTDKKSLNGVWVNGMRIPAERAHPLRLGDSIQLGVATAGARVEHDYIFVRRPLKDIKPHLAQVCNRMAKASPVANATSKRKFSADETEPSTSSKPKLYRGSAPNTSAAQPCPAVEHKRKPRPPSEDLSAHSGKQPDEILISDGSNSASDLDNLQMFSQNILTLRARVNDTQKQVASLEGTSQQGDAAKEAQVRELQGQLGALRTKMQHMETLEKTFNQPKTHLKTKQEEEVLKKQLEEALQEQRNVMEELAHSRQGFEEILLAKNKELEVTKEEKEKERAEKEEVVTQMTEVMENELQCIICSELFIQAYVLNCAHIFCLYCIGEWRKRKDECPICRQTIRTQTRCLPLDNFIDGMVQNLSADTKARRQVLVAERQGAKARPPEVMVIQDDSSSSSSSSGSSSSSSSSNNSNNSNNSSLVNASGSELEEVESIGSADSSIHLDSSGDGSVHSVGTDSSVQNLDSSSPGSNAYSEDDDGVYSW
ncbi:unnamed protein product [Merluccius merluccius]